MATLTIPNSAINDDSPHKPESGALKVYTYGQGVVHPVGTGKMVGLNDLLERISIPPGTALVDIDAKYQYRNNRGSIDLYYIGRDGFNMWAVDNNGIAYYVMFDSPDKDLSVGQLYALQAKYARMVRGD